MAKGSQNEDHIARWLPAFAKRYSTFEISTILEYGLIVQKGNNTIATSVDGIALLKEQSTAECTLAACEYKTRSGATQRDAIVKIAADHQKWNVVSLQLNAASDQKREFQKLIPDRSYRQQILHHCATLGLQRVLYIEATLREIVYVVEVIFNQDLLDAYTDFISELVHPLAQLYHEIHIDDDLEPIREAFRELSDPDWAVDEETYVLQFALWKLLDNMSKTNPVPSIKRILPALVNAWNALKGIVLLDNKTIQKV